MHSLLQSYQFDQADYDMLRIINAAIDRETCGTAVAETDSDLQTLLPGMHPHGILNLTTTHGFRMANAVLRLLGKLDRESRPEERIDALRTLHNEVLQSAQTTFRYNTGRVLLQIMKDLIRARGDEACQLRLVHDFRRAAGGNPRIVRELLTRCCLLEMPEDWNQRTLDDHVHDASTKGRKNPTYLLMDAWIKGIRQLTVVYYNVIEPDTAKELLEGAEILGMHVRIGLKFTPVHRGRYISMLWVPRGFADSEDFLAFLNSDAMLSLTEEGRLAEHWFKKRMLTSLELFNTRHAPVIEETYGLKLPRLSREDFLETTRAGKPSFARLAEYAHKVCLPAIREAAQALTAEEPADEEARKTRNEKLTALNALTPQMFFEHWIAPQVNPETARGMQPDDEERPAILRLSVEALVARLLSLRAGYRLTLMLERLDEKDVLEILRDAGGAVTHLEVFNMKAWQAGELTHLSAICALQRAINEGRVPVLKRMILGMIEDLTAEGTADALERAAKFDRILRNIPLLQRYYSRTPLDSHIGTDGAFRLGMRYGMGLAVVDTLPRNVQRRLHARSAFRPAAVPIRVKVAFEDRYETPDKPCPWAEAVRRIPGMSRFGLRSERHWLVSYDSLRLCKNPEDSNVVALGGAVESRDNGLLSEEQKPAETQTAASLKSDTAYLNTDLMNAFKIAVGFIPAFFTFMLTQDQALLAWFGALIWFGITGVRNIIQALIAGDGLNRQMLFSWKSLVNRSRIADSLMYTGISVVLLEGITRNILLGHILGLTVETHALLVFTIIAIANGTYISTHNIYRGFPTAAVAGNFFRSIFAIPVAMLYNSALAVILPVLTGQPADVLLVPAAAIVSKLASDTVAGIIESFADRLNNLRLRAHDVRSQLKHLFDCMTRLELLFPNEDVPALLAHPKTFLARLREVKPLLADEMIGIALDLMYFRYYLPCARVTLEETLHNLSADEKLVFRRFNGVLLDVRSVSELFLAGHCGRNFTGALAFYLDNHEMYLRHIDKLSETPQK